MDRYEIELIELNACIEHLEERKCERKKHVCNLKRLYDYDKSETNYGYIKKEEIKIKEFKQRLKIKTLRRNLIIQFLK